MQKLKIILREMLILLHFDITKNLKYDRLTRKILQQHIQIDSNCIDIGCHKGEILEQMLQLAPKGKHYAFEPIPDLYQHLQEKYGEKALIYPYALSDKNGTSAFQLVTNAPAYSGLKKRHYDVKNPIIEEIKVEVKTLDNIIHHTEPIHLIKIDVEGGEWDVLKGAKNLLTANQPIIIFEYGKGAGDYYETQPKDIYLLLKEIGLSIYTLSAFINKKAALDIHEFKNYFYSNKEYYFVASKEIKK